MESRCLGCMQIKHSSVCEHCGFDERTRNQKHQLPIGSEVGGQYILGRVLGQGGFGITYIAWDKIMHQTVAIKEYFPSGFAGRDTYDHSVSSYDDREKNTFESNKKRFLREAESLAKLWSIPQIVKILRCFEENGTAYIAMEYVEGMDLRRYLKQLGRPMTMEEVLSILGPVMDALEQVHRANLVHRDISPDNIMVLPDGSAKLLDFGAARYVENANAEKDRNTSTQAILKHGFAPPEQYSSHGALGPWTDVYAMCATIYYCLTGKVPPEAMARVIEGLEVDWSRIYELKESQKVALMQGMEPQAKRRFTSIEELSNALQNSLKLDFEPFAQFSSNSKENRNNITLNSLSDSSNVTMNKKRGSKRFLLPALLLFFIGIGIFSFCCLTEAYHFEIPEILEFLDIELEDTVEIQVLSRHSRDAISWGSSNPEVAVISDNGILTVKGYGTTQITASYKDTVATCTVTISLKANVNCKYTSNESGVTIIGFDGILPDQIILPREIDNKLVTEIGNDAFLNCSNLTSVIIPDSVTAIGTHAFKYCTSLCEISLPKSVESIGDGAFAYCKNMTRINIPDSVISIGNHAFAYCSNLTKIIIPDSITTLENNSFQGCSSLSEITISENIVSIGDYTFAYCKSLTNVTLPEQLTSIGAYAFDTCFNLSSMAIPDSTVSIKNHAFRNCTSLSKINLPDNLSSIESGVFFGCISLTDISIPVGVNFIGESAFYGCSGITGINIPDTVTFISDKAFYGCSNMIYVSMPTHMTSIGDNVFSDCSKLIGITIPKGITSIPHGMFSHCSSLSIISIPSTITSIGTSAFNGCRSISSIDIPRGTTSIGSSAFLGCDQLQRVSIPRNCKIDTSYWGRSFPSTCQILYY